MTAAEMMPASCPLCAAEPLTTRVHECDRCWVADCRTCHTPMVIWKHHGGEVPAGDVDHMLAELARAAADRFPGGHVVDRRMRTIPAHWHAHGRSRDALRVVRYSDSVDNSIADVTESRPAVGWRIWNVAVDDTVVNSPAILVSPFPDQRAFDRAEISEIKPFLGRASRASCPQCGDPPGRDGCGYYAVVNPGDLHEIDGWFREMVNYVNYGYTRAGYGVRPVGKVHFGKRLWNPGDLRQMGLVTKVAGWGRVVHGRDGLRGWQVPIWRSEWMSITDILVPQPCVSMFDHLGDIVEALTSRYQVPVTIVPTGGAPTPLASIVARSGGPASAPADRRRTNVFGEPIFGVIAVAVGDDIWTGGHSDTNLDRCAELGFTHVIDCRAEKSCVADVSDHPEVEYLWAPTADDGTAKDGSWFGPAVEFALKALDRPGARIYVHCWLGLRRGPSMVYAILRAQGHSVDEARAMVMAARPLAELCYADDAERFLASIRPSTDALT